MLYVLLLLTVNMTDTTILYDLLLVLSTLPQLCDDHRLYVLDTDNTTFAITATDCDAIHLMCQMTSHVSILALT